MKTTELGPVHEGEEEFSESRAVLIWQVFVFQLKLVADGLRDVILVPISLVAALLGLIAGGDQPHQYFRKVLMLGRRTEIWINLFGHRKHGNTSDALIEPIRNRILSEAQRSPWVRRAGHGINKTLDDINDRIGTTTKSKEQDTESD